MTYSRARVSATLADGASALPGCESFSDEPLPSCPVVIVSDVAEESARSVVPLGRTVMLTHEMTGAIGRGIMLLDALDDEAFDLFKETELAASIAAVVVAVFLACASNLPTVSFHRESGRRGKKQGDITALNTLINRSSDVKFVPQVGVCEN